MTAKEVAACIDHTLLKPEAIATQIDRLCDEAIEFGFAAVCVNPVFVRRAHARVAEHGIAVAGVVGFPLGATTAEAKADEARRIIDDGATEIDMVAMLGALIGGDTAAVTYDVRSVAEVVHRRAKDGVLKVILETAALTTEQVELGCRCCVEGGADYVKTSTGFHPSGGATIEHVRMLKRFAAPLKVKAAGGIRTAGAAMAMLEAGAARLGTSSSVAILNELNRSTT